MLLVGAGTPLLPALLLERGAKVRTVTTDVTTGAAGAAGATGGAGQYPSLHGGWWRGHQSSGLFSLLGCSLGSRGACRRRLSLGDAGTVVVLTAVVLAVVVIIAGRFVGLLLVIRVVTPAGVTAIGCV